MSKPDKIHLASGSPRRRDLLLELGLRFEVVKVNVDEFEDPQADPSALVYHNAVLKARAGAEAYPDALVLGADTTVFHDQTVLGKPADMEHARELLRSLSGNAHIVYTAFCLIGPNGIDEAHCVDSVVQFKDFGDDTITQYFQIVNPLDKAGAYGIQEGRELIIDHWDGSFNNIMGLPTEKLTEVLTELDILEGLKV